MLSLTLTSLLYINELNVNRYHNVTLKLKLVWHSNGTYFKNQLQMFNEPNKPQ
jgi:hypothetical protein